MKHNFFNPRIASVINELNQCHGAVKKREKLLDLGFEYVEDDDIDTDILDEQVAKPENDRQRYLLDFFHGIQLPTASVLDAFLEERKAANTNYPLIRRYFRSANSQLKKLLLFGLDLYPLNRELLDDITFYNEFSLYLKELIAFYIHACCESTDLSLFEKLVEDFYCGTISHSYDAIAALLDHSNTTQEKAKILVDLKAVLEKQNKGISF